MRVSLQLYAKHVPLIKFVGGPHKFTSSPSTTIRPHPCAPDSIIPGSVPEFIVKVSRTASSAGPFTSRNALPKRFRYTLLEEAEIDEVNTGGAEIVY